ncbi:MULTISPECIES: Asp23/Gls24 family envelope stress response protein [Clostridium]|uniref:Asp23/Gls24 family envelope stress response protein n=1 Tax=Clostridium manihotivorum TaxID=2320868 RepID=A0A410DSM3_9CLOT|nr:MULTISPECIES: Asp23/Gls24 family envelope stress response protein [Clostridium]QAA32066.1 Asp23/Gls24 family envelope stress response protein [Clostridium manihotivorum]
MEELNREETNIGVVKISDEVVSVIAGIAASEVNGVVESNPGVAGGITQIFTGKKNTGKGVKVSIENGEAQIELTLAVLYGTRIPEVVVQVQDNVKKTVEAMTGLSVAAVNIFIQNIIVPKNDEKSEEVHE